MLSKRKPDLDTNDMDCSTVAISVKMGGKSSQYEPKFSLDHLNHSEGSVSQAPRLPLKACGLPVGHRCHPDGLVRMCECVLQRL